MKKILSAVCATALAVSAFSAAAAPVSASGKGDYNNDGRVDTSDVREMLSAVIYDTAPTQQQLWWGDYNQDGVIDTTDARYLLGVSLVSNETIDYTTTENRDWWGEKSVAVLGDSISFGSGCSGNIADNSYVGLIKKAVCEQNGSPNYGFMPAYTTNWTPRSEEVCAWPTMTGGPGVVGNSQGWTETDDGDRLMYFGLTAYAKDATLTYKLRSGYSFEYVCVYYQTGPSHGAFVVGSKSGTTVTPKAEVDADQTMTYDCENTVEETKRTGFFKVSDLSGGITVSIVSEDNQPVTITGLGFYNDITGDEITFNNYSRGGSMLTPLSDTVLSQAASAGTLIVGIGYNDFFWGNAYQYTKADFTDRIDYLIAECNKNGTNVIVNDYLWSNYKSNTTYKHYSAAVKADVDEKYVFFKQELKRLAAETNGIYVCQEDRWGEEIVAYADANDGVHPTNAGHALMAQAILEAMGLV